MVRCHIKYTIVALGKIGEIIASKILFARNGGNLLCFVRLKRVWMAFSSKLSGANEKLHVAEMGIHK